MPLSRELQFPAMAVLQTYVNEYDAKVYFTGMRAMGINLNLEYSVIMPEEDWQLFQDIGLELKQQPVHSIAEADAEVDLTEDRLASYQWRTDQHVAQIYGQMIGVETKVLPKIRQLQPGQQWFTVDGEIAVGLGLPEIDGDTLVRAVDGQIGGIIGWASWVTYLACAQGLPVIEIKPSGRSPNYLSKWSHKQYRMIDGGSSLMPQLQSALLDLETPCSTAVAEAITGRMQMAR